MGITIFFTFVFLWFLKLKNTYPHPRTALFSTYVKFEHLRSLIVRRSSDLKHCACLFSVFPQKVIHPSLMVLLWCRRLLSSMAEKCKRFWKPSTPWHIGINWKALAEYYQIRMPRFQSFFSFFLHHLVLTKLATRRQRVNACIPQQKTIRSVYKL